MSPARSFSAGEGRIIVDALVAAIDEQAATLSRIDGAIGDGDHGVNMRKGFLLARDALPASVTLSEGLAAIGETLMTRIGGAMGPLYGSFFVEMAEACAGETEIDAAVFERMLQAGRLAVEDLGEASVGDKTMLDTLVPATDAFCQSVAEGADFATSLEVMAQAAEDGKESTKDLVARVGRASRLGERSRGVLDAGATSCWILLSAMASSMRTLLTLRP